MPQASAASFFPTAKELSSGVQWFKDHPVLAAAAATAVSVITYLNALELAKGDDDAVAQENKPSAASHSSRHRKPTRKSSAGAPSDTKLSAAVSWCDEHGGSLTQVFEDEAPGPDQRRDPLEDSDSEDDACDDVAERVEDACPPHSVTTQQEEGDAVAVGTRTVNDAEADVVQTESPQWGWYVPITPPQDQFHAPTGHDATGGVAPGPPKTMRRTASGKIS
ncbi:hypothetical protein PsorP6_005628 [Peronosclerospora sorghi]|uniref:Uncharacterized protein n=1 Tax=Peronosclerospora sorghi TaxID=230839 RepID=A0ACC0W266_9STRA|nr:hypothetical protein PsorP6_005628 [Peronosclerospora sorghi]